MPGAPRPGAGGRLGAGHHRDDVRGSSPLHGPHRAGDVAVRPGGGWLLAPRGPGRTGLDQLRGRPLEPLPRVGGGRVPWPAKPGVRGSRQGRRSPRLRPVHQPHRGPRHPPLGHPIRRVGLVLDLHRDDRHVRDGEGRPRAPVVVPLRRAHRWDVRSRGKGLGHGSGRAPLRGSGDRLAALRPLALGLLRRPGRAAGPLPRSASRGRPGRHPVVPRQQRRGGGNRAGRDGGLRLRAGPGDRAPAPRPRSPGDGGPPGGRARGRGDRPAHRGRAGGGARAAGGRPGHPGLVRAGAALRPPRPAPALGQRPRKRGRGGRPRLLAVRAERRPAPGPHRGHRPASPGALRRLQRRARLGRAARGRQHPAPDRPVERRGPRLHDRPPPGGEGPLLAPPVPCRLHPGEEPPGGGAGGGRGVDPRPRRRAHRDPVVRPGAGGRGRGLDRLRGDGGADAARVHPGPAGAAHLRRAPRGHRAPLAGAHPRRAPAQPAVVSPRGGHRVPDPTRGSRRTVADPRRRRGALLPGAGDRGLADRPGPAASA